MKTNLLSFIAFVVCACMVSCNTGENLIIENPYCSHQLDSKLYVQRVEVSNQFTILDFVSMSMYDTTAVMWVTLDSKSYIQTANGKKYKLVKAEGINLSTDGSARTYFATVDNFIHFRLYFEPIPKRSKIISFVEPEGWHIDDISLIESSSEKLLRYEYNEYPWEVGKGKDKKEVIVLAVSSFVSSNHDEHSMYFSHKCVDISAQVAVSDCKDFLADYNSIVNNGYYTASQSFSGTEYNVRQLVRMGENDFMVGDIHAYFKDGKKYEVIYMWMYGYPFAHVLAEQYIKDNAIAIAFEESEITPIENNYIPLTKVYGIPQNCISTQYQDFEVTILELRDDCTLVHKRCSPKVKDTKLTVHFNEKEFIEDAVSGKKYYIISSTLSMNSEYPTIMEENMAIDFVEVYPPIPGVRSLNINSGFEYYLKNIELVRQ